MMTLLRVRWSCPHCKASGWDVVGQAVSGRFDHDRPSGRRCRKAEADKMPGHLKSRRIRMCDAAALVLRETNNSAVYAYDDQLCRIILERTGMSMSDPHPQVVCQRVMNALTRQHGELVPKMTRGPRNRSVRIFYLPEKA